MIEQNKKQNKHKKYLAALVILAMLVIAAVLGKCFLLYTDLQSKLIQKQAVIQELRNRNEAQRHSAATVVSWQRITIECLVRMANLTLNTTGDVKTALEFLLEAKKYTNDLEEPTINHALDKDIASLKAVPIVNTEELVLRINAVIGQVDNLSIIPVIVATISRDAATETAAVTTLRSKYLILLNEFFTSATKALKNIVIIRRQATQPMLPPEQLVILRFNIQAKLLQAELAATQRQDKLYHMCLTQAIDLITKYFVYSNNTAANVLHTLQELQQFNLQPNLPLLTDSLMAIKKS